MEPSIKDIDTTNAGALGRKQVEAHILFQLLHGCLPSKESVASIHEIKWAL